MVLIKKRSYWGVEKSTDNYALLMEIFRRIKRSFITPNGKGIPIRNVSNLPLAFWQAVFRKAFGKIPRLPWIPFAAAREIDRLMEPDWKVFEVGAGFSTLWLSDRCGELTSIEASDDWHFQLSKILEEEQRSNVDLRHIWKREMMADFSGVEDQSIDLLFVDGGPREQCFLNGFRKVRLGGYIYLDNWENLEFWPSREQLFHKVDVDTSSIASFVDYVPAQVGVYEGLLLRKLRS